MKVADFRPASSPGEASAISTSKPRRSAQRRYMRRRISAQSWESVPPAPAWTVTTASPASYSPLKRRASSSSASRDSTVGQLTLQFALDLLVFLGQLGEVVEFADVGLQPPEHLQPALGAGVGGGGPRRDLLVVPEAGRAHLLLELGCLLL